MKCVGIMIRDMQMAMVIYESIDSSIQGVHGRGACKFRVPSSNNAIVVDTNHTR